VIPPRVASLAARVARLDDDQLNRLAAFLDGMGA
jgi:hypothetical protein